MSRGRISPNAARASMEQRTELGPAQSDTASEGTLLGDSNLGGEQLSQIQGDGRPLWGLELQLLTVVEVARMLVIGRSKVYELLYSGELKSVKIGAARRVRYSDLRDYVRYLDDES